MDLYSARKDSDLFVWGKKKTNTNKKEIKKTYSISNCI